MPTEPTTPSSPVPDEPAAPVPPAEQAAPVPPVPPAPPAEQAAPVPAAGPEEVWFAPPGAVDEIDLPSVTAGRYGLAQRLAAETFGTFALVLVVIGTLLYGTTLYGTPSELGALGTGLAAGLALIGLYSAFVHVSGAHLNPAISVGSAIAGRITALDAVFYVVAQVIGSALAVAVLYTTIPEKLVSLTGSADATAFLAKTANGWGEASALSVLSSGQAEFGLIAALLVETIGTAVLVGVVLASRPSARSATAVGATYAALILLAGPITGGGFNPARSTAVDLFIIGADGPAVGQLWLFWVAPLVGGAIAGLAKLAFSQRERAEIEAALVAAQDSADA